MKVFGGQKSYGGQFLTEGLAGFTPGRWDELIVDFGDCRFLEPVQLVSLASLIEVYAQDEVEIRFEGLTHLEVAEYLKNIRFFDYWQEGFDREAYTDTRIGTNLGLWKISRPMIDAYTHSARQFYESNFFPQYDLSPFSVALMEVFNNIFDHSQSPVSGYTISQYYPKSHKLKVAACDLGVGIANKVNTFFAEKNQSTLVDHEAVKRAFVKSFSTKSTVRNRGFRLNTIKDICNECDGRIFVASNAGVVKYEGNLLHSYPVRHSFPGTHFEFVLDTRSFDQAEPNYDNEILSLDDIF